MQPGDYDWNMRRMFDLYVLDYMARNNMPTTAEIFKNEAQVADHDISTTRTDGFLSDWWAIFTDVYASRFAEQKEASENLNAQTTQMGPLPQMDRGKSPMYNGSFDMSMTMANPTTCLEDEKSFEEECQKFLESEPNIPMISNMAGTGTSSSHLQQMISNGRPPMVPRENRERGVWGRNALNDPTPLGEQNPYLLPGKTGAGRTPGINYLQLQRSPLGVSNQLPGHVRDQVPYTLPQVPQQQMQTTQQGSFVSSELGQSMQSFLQAPQQQQIQSHQQGSFVSSELGQSMQSFLQAPQQQQIQSQQQGSFVSSELGQSMQSFLQAPQQQQIQSQQQGSFVSSELGQSMQSFLQAPQQQQIQSQQQGSFVSSELGQSMQSFLQAPQQQQIQSQQQGSFVSSELGQSMQSFLQVPQQQIQSQLGSFISSEFGQSVQSYPGMSTDLIGPSRFVSTNNEMDPRITAYFKRPTANAQKEEIQPQRQETDRKEKKRKASSNATNEDRISSGKANDEENISIDAFLSQEEEDAADDSSAWYSSGRKQDQGFSFEQIGRLHSSKSKMVCCHFSSGGTLLASAGHDKKVYICNVGSFDVKCSSEEHTQLISDVRFRPKSTFLATASFDKSIIMWNAHRLNKPLFRLLGHNEQVTSLDFSPRKTNYLSSCDSNGEIRLWNINQADKCIRVARGASRVVRFQPQTGDFLAGAHGNVINLIDIETGETQFDLKGHTSDVRSLCWDISGKYIASASEDSARIWSVATGKCIHRLYSDGNNFQSCIFHPAYMLMVVLGGYQNLHLWNPTESSKTMTVEAHEGYVASLSESSQNELMASASHDQWVKLWK